MRSAPLRSAVAMNTTHGSSKRMPHRRCREASTPTHRTNTTRSEDIAFLFLPPYRIRPLRQSFRLDQQAAEGRVELSQLCTGLPSVIRYADADELVLQQSGRTDPLKAANFVPPGNPA